jgi:predicted HicB family RNase H-like nuclease
MSLDMAPLWRHNGTMDLDTYVEAVQRQLAAAAEAGGEESRELAVRLAATLDSAVRLALQDALAAAAAEITLELAPGSVELRLRGGEHEFVVVLPDSDAPDRGAAEPPPASIAGEADHGGTARINLRLPAHVKAQVEAAAVAAGLSVNTWLVRVAALAAQGAGSGTRDDRERFSHEGRRYKGWAR